MMENNLINMLRVLVDRENFSLYSHENKLNERYFSFNQMKEENDF